jgi:hypothetical protein
MSDALDIIDLGVTLAAAGILGCAAHALLTRIDRARVRAWRALAATLRRRRRSDVEEFLAHSADRFELERRERAWIGDRDGGSLLGG